MVGNCEIGWVIDLWDCLCWWAMEYFMIESYDVDWHCEKGEWWGIENGNDWA